MPHQFYHGQQSWYAAVPGWEVDGITLGVAHAVGFGSLISRSHLWPSMFQQPNSLAKLMVSSIYFWMFGNCFIIIDLRWGGNALAGLGDSQSALAVDSHKVYALRPVPHFFCHIFFFHVKHLGSSSGMNIFPVLKASHVLTSALMAAAILGSICEWSFDAGIGPYRGQSLSYLASTFGSYRYILEFGLLLEAADYRHRLCVGSIRPASFAVNHRRRCVGIGRFWQFEVPERPKYLLITLASQLKLIFTHAYISCLWVGAWGWGGMRFWL